MYTVAQILAAAGGTAQDWTRGGVTVKLTANNQLIGTYAELTRFRENNRDHYNGWEAHHIFEDQDVRLLGLVPFSPAYQQMICVLIPEQKHKRINGDLHTGKAQEIAEIEQSYRRVYEQDLDNYCGAASAAALRAELMAILDAVLKNLFGAKAQQLAEARSNAQVLANKISMDRKWYEQLVRESSPNALQIAKFAAETLVMPGLAFVNPSNQVAIGGAVNLLNKYKVDTRLWSEAEQHVRAASEALKKGDLVSGVAKLALAESHYKKASLQFRHYREGIELAATKAEIGIEAAAVLAIVVASGVYVAGALGAGGAAAGGAAEAGGTTPLVRIALEEPKIRVALEAVEKGVRVFVEASDLAAEEEAEGEIVEGVKRMYVGR
jgi:hypothetical protein